jgi:hypothetical protein
MSKSKISKQVEQVMSLQAKRDIIVGQWVAKQARENPTAQFEVVGLCEKCSGAVFVELRPVTSERLEVCPVCDYASPCEPAFALRFPIPSQE